MRPCIVLRRMCAGVVACVFVLVLHDAAFGRPTPAAPRQTARPKAAARATSASAVTSPASAATFPQTAAVGLAAGGVVAKSRNVAVGATSMNLYKAVEMFYMDTGRLPRNVEGLSALLAQPAGLKNWKGPYITRSSGRDPLIDPWGNRYHYQDTTRPGGQPSFSIASFGPDGIEGNADDIKVGF